MQYDRNHALLSSEIPGLPAPKRGKVRDVYDLGDTLLFVATDRLSAFDVIMPNGVPDKGRVLTQLSLFWFRFFSDVPNHLVTADVAEYPEVLKPWAADLDGRSMIVRKLEMVPVECIARGYLVGSGWAEYKRQGTVCSQALRPGYVQADRLDEAIFTPSMKAEIGEHDENVSVAELERRGWDVLPSESNFVFAKPAHASAADVFERLRGRHIYVRYFTGPKTADRLRVTIGTDAQMDRLLDALAEFDK